MSSSRIWVGGYTDDMNGSAAGIAVLGIAGDGSLEDRGLAAAADSPSFLTRAGDAVYAVGEGTGTVSAYRIAGNELHLLGVQDAAGALPCALTVLGNRELLAVACYGDGTVDVHPIGSEGSLGPTSQSLRGAEATLGATNDGPHAHASLQIDDHTVLTTDLGTDRVYLHSLHDGLLTRTGSLRFPTGTGPRDLMLHPSGLVWMLSELSHEIFVLRGEGGSLAIVGSVALPGAEKGDHASGIALSADGAFAYAALRGSDTIAVLAVRDEGARLAAVGSVSSAGGWPRHLVMDGEYLRVANQLTNSVVTFTLGGDGLPIKHSALDVRSPTYLLLG